MARARNAARRPWTTGVGIAITTLAVALVVGCPKEDGAIVAPLPPPKTTSSGVGGSGGMTGAGGAGDGGFADDNCSVQPCKLVLSQCGCNIGQRCVHSVDGRRCVAAGGTPASAACDSDCQTGYICADNGTGAPRMCHRYCDTDTDCPGDGARCILAIAGIDESLCTADCDPILQDGCPAAGTKCDVGIATATPFSHCTGLGDGVQDDLCATPSECAAGLTCTSVNAGPLTCYTLCDVAAPICPANTTCTSFTPPIQVGPDEYGICN